MTCCAYEERKAAGANKGFGGGVTTTQVSYPVPAANASTSSGSVGMRTLFNASGVVSPTNTGNGGGCIDWGYHAYEEGQAMPLGMSAMRVIWGMTCVEDCLNE